MTIDLIQRATEVRTKLGLPDKAFIIFVLAPGKQAAVDLRNAKGMPNGLGISLYASNIEIEVVDIDSKDMSVIRGISALHCITKPEYWEAAPDFVKKAIQNSLAVTAATIEVSVQTLITGPEALVKDPK